MTFPPPPLPAKLYFVPQPLTTASKTIYCKYNIRSVRVFFLDNVYIRVEVKQKTGKGWENSWHEWMVSGWGWPVTANLTFWSCAIYWNLATVALSEKCIEFKKVTCEPALFCGFLKTIVLESMSQFHISSCPYTAALTIAVSYPVQNHYWQVSLYLLYATVHAEV